MPIQLVAAQPAHVPEIGRILFEAFTKVAIDHGHPTDIPTLAFGIEVAELFITRPDFLGVVALDGAKVLGSNFAMVGDDVAGVGPITVDPAAQARGIGKLLMQNIIDQCTERGFTRIRLLQDAFNRTSLALYARLGYVVREPIADIFTAPGAAPDPTVRLATEADVPAMDALQKNLTGLSRRTELTLALRGGFPVTLRQRHGHTTGYLISTIFGHGIAETVDDAIALTQQTANLSPEGNHFMLPLRNAAFYKAAMNLGMRTDKVMNLMSIGDYQDPTGVWMPSIAY